MASVRIILRKKPNQDGTHALAIQITKDRRKSIMHVGQNIPLDDWDAEKQMVKRSHPNHKRLNNFLLKKKAEANDKVLEVETHKTDVSARALRQSVKPSGGATFFNQAEIWLKELKDSSKYNQYVSEKPRIKHFREFLDGADIGFSDITVGMLEKYKSYLRSIQKVGERTIINHLITIRSVFSHAIKNHMIDSRFYPFGKGKVKIKNPESVKIGLTAEEITQLEQAQFATDYPHHCRNLFLISFYFAGMRVSDVLRLKHGDFKDGRLHYTMGKNNKAGSLKVPQQALAILNQYPKLDENKHDLIFPELQRLHSLDDAYEVQRLISFAVNRIDKCLRKEVAPTAKIDKKLTMHIARHSFGNISGDRIPVQMLQKLYRHSKIETTIGYQANFIHKDADDALEAVLRFDPS